jgi:hypothetical protein
MTKVNKNQNSSPEGVERRKTQRRPMMATFSVFIVIPKRGLHRLEVHDVSEMGIGFDLDVEGEDSLNFPVKEGDTVDFRFYLNQSLYIPLSIQIVRLQEHHQVRRVGAEFQDKTSQNYQAFLSFLHFLDQILNVVQVETQPS